MNFLNDILGRLASTPVRPVLREVRDGSFVTVTNAGLLDQISAVREFARSSGLKKGDRCALLAGNGIRWIAIDIALMSEGIIVVPLYSRQAASELAFMIRDAGVSMILCDSGTLRDSVTAELTKTDAVSAPLVKLFEEIPVTGSFDVARKANTIALAATDPIAIVYTSGTSGEPKGVVLNLGNVQHVLECTGASLTRLMRGQTEIEQVFHYLPLCFAGSWMLTLSCLMRNSLLTLSTNLEKLAEELKLAKPQYCLNVPALLERIKTGVEAQIGHKPDWVQSLYVKSKAAWLAKRDGNGSLGGSFWMFVGNRLIFQSIRKKIGSNLKALICGSAPLTKETQLFFIMLGIPVLQVYGLTETTAICTMDDPLDYDPGRVGPAIPQVEMKLGENNEILVRGPNVFSGYWNRPEAFAAAVRDGWFHTGDQGEVNERGDWLISGRIKNLIILSSGHNIAPEPIEERIRQSLPDAAQVVLQGNGRGYLTAVITGDLETAKVNSALEAINKELPHYRNVRSFCLRREPMTIADGLLTANGKLKRDAISSFFKNEIDDIYESRRQQQQQHEMHESRGA